MSEPLEFLSANDPKDRRLLGDNRPAERAEEERRGPRPFHGFHVERDTYERLKPALLEGSEGQFVVVVGEEFAGPVGTSDEAEALGYERFGLGPLYVKRVLARDPADEISREFAG